MKLISWNVNGIRACIQKGFLDFFKEEDADIFCLQETKQIGRASCREKCSVGCIYRWSPYH